MILSSQLGENLCLVNSVAGGQEVQRYRLTTGTAQLTGPLMPGSSLQNNPLVAGGLTVAVARTQNDPAADFLYRIGDELGSMVELWKAPIDWTTYSSFTVGPDRSLYALADGYRLTRFDPADGSVLNQSAPLPTDGYATRLASDLDGRVYCLTGSDPTSLLYAFDPDLTLRWTMPAPSVNVGGPVLAAPDEFGSSYLIVAGQDTLRAYRTPPPFTGEGFALAQSNGVEPTLEVQSALTPGGLIRVEIGEALPFTPVYLVYGPGTAFLPFGPLTLVPRPGQIQFVGQAGACGVLLRTGTWPLAASPGLPVAFQALVVDMGVPGWLAATRGLSGIGAN